MSSTHATLSQAQAELDQRWLQGEPGTLAELHRVYRRRLEAIAYRVLRNRADAEDVVQRVFLQLPRAAYRGRASLWSYLYRAAVNGSVNVLRTRKRRERVERELVDRSELDVTDVCAAPPTNPESRVLEGELLAGIAKGLLRVKPQHRRALLLRIVWGLSNAEIAEREGVPAATVGTWLRRGRAELVREMGPMLDEFQPSEGNES